MARSARKPERETDESAKQASKKPDKTIATLAAGEAGKTAAKAASGASSKPDIEFARFQSGQFELLRAMLEKRSDANASVRTIAEEFAALWLPVHAVDLELLVPALREAGVPESQSYAARVRKDLLNIVLADLIGNDHVQDTSGARLEALSDAFDGYQKAAEQEREGLGEKEGDLGRRMKDRFERLKGRFSDLDDALGEAMDLLAPRSLSVPASRRRSHRENDMPRYSSDTPERDDQGRFTSDNDRGSSRGRGGGDRDESGRFASEERSSRSRYDDDDNRSRGRDESGRFSSEGRSSRSRHDDDDNRSRGRDESGRFASERYRDDNEDRSRGRDESGRFMSERNRRFDEDTRSRAGTTTAIRIAAPSTAAGTMMIATKAEAAAGLAIPRVIRKPLAGPGNAPTAGTGAGTTTATQIAAPPAAAGMMTTATRAEAAAGLTTPKVTRTRLAGVGRTDIDPNAATMRMDAVEAHARMRVSPVAGPATTMIGVAKADGARRTMMIVDRRRPDGAMADGRAIPRAMPRLRAVGGKTAGRT
jgi:hypothetical protein